MEQHEKEMLEKIRQQSDNIEIPENLRPEKIEQQLQKRKYKKRRNVYTGILAAAGFAAVFGMVVIYGGINQRRIEKEIIQQNPVVAEEKKHSSIKTAKAYEDIFAYIEQYEENTEVMGVFDEFFDFLGGVARSDNAKMESESAEEAKGNSGDYSKTNTREENVDEADIAKTDGRYIYTVTEELNAIGIVDTKEERMKEVTTLVLEDCELIYEIYVKENRLVVLYEEIWKEDTAAINLKTAIYDISDIANPKRMNDFVQSGRYYTSRLNGDYLYLFSRYSAHIGCKKNQYEEYIPYVDDEIFPLEKIWLPDTERASTYIVVTSVDLKNPDEIVDTCSILSDSATCYVSPENIYICDYAFGEAETNTSIRKISYKDGKMEGVAKTKVAGYLNDSFSIDEYKGYLRMVVSLDRTNTNSVYILDEKLELTGKIQGLAKNERVYSARFMGDIGYFVTFRETDPLFSVDLSNPENPKIIGSLKIPGFSEYLHPYGEGFLLGIGKEVDDRQVTTDEVKLSMFDISDPSNVKEIHKCVIENAYDSPAFYDYKSVTINAEKNMIGFTTYAEHEKYYLYEYDKDKGFICNMEEGMSGSYWATRGIYIGDVLYLVNGSRVESYNLQNFEKIDDIIL